MSRLTDYDLLWLLRFYLVLANVANGAYLLFGFRLP